MLRGLGSLACVLLLAGVARADPIFFKWVDNEGNLHVTDRLADVPEPYYSLYAAKLAELEQSKQGKQTPRQPRPQASPRPAPPAATPSPAPRPFAGTSITEQEIKRRAQWKALMARWRAELELATLAYEKAQEDLDNAQLNPILRQTPQVRQRIAQAQQRRDSALVRLENARTMLLVELPKQAKREQVPPKWLQ